MKRLGLSLFVLAVLLAAAPATRAASVTGVEITKYGLVKVEVLRREPSPGTTTGQLRITKTTLARTTDRVPARKGVSFGYYYRVLGSPAGARVTLTFKTLTPGLRRPGERDVRRESIYMRPKAIGLEYGASYTLEEDWEVVPGRWTFQVLYEGRLLAEKSFTLYRP